MGYGEHLRCIGGVARGSLEGLFTERLQEAQPRESAVDLFEQILLDVGDSRELLRKQQKKRTKNRRAEIKKEIGQYLELIRRSSNTSVQELYEQKILGLQEEQEDLGIEEEASLDQFEPVLEAGREYLRNPIGIWENGDLRRRRAVQNLVFDGPISFHPEQGLYTAEFSLLYRLLGTSEGGESSLVDVIRPKRKKHTFTHHHFLIFQSKKSLTQ